MGCFRINNPTHFYSPILKNFGEIVQLTEKKYRYGFNGKESESDIVEGDYDFGARIYDGRLGRWMSLDPLQQKYPHLSPYNFCSNSPLRFIDPDGKYILPVNAKSDADLISHWQTAFKIKDNTSVMADVFAMARTVTQTANPKNLSETITTITYSTEGFTDKQRKAFDKAYNKASKGLSEDQKIIAQGYYDLITSRKGTKYASYDPSLSLDAQNINFNNDANKQTYGSNRQLEAALSSSGGGMTFPNENNSLVVVWNEEIAKHPVTINDEKSGSGTSSASVGEVNAHEMVGHALDNNNGITGVNDGTRSVQISNVYRRIENKPGRNGNDHANTKTDPKILNRAPSTKP